MDREVGLMEEARQGSLEGFSELIRLHQAQVRAYLARYVRRREAIDDLAQESFFAAFRSLSAFQGKSSFRLWLLGIARNQALMFLRKEFARRSERIDSFHEALEEWLAADLEHEAEDPAAQAREVGALRGCLGQLPEGSASVVRQHYFKRMTASQIGQATGRSPGAVWVALLRIREALRRCIEKKIGVPEVVGE